jgi:hypothetical protein
MYEGIMSTAEIHDFGVEIVFNYLKKEGHEIVSVNSDIDVNPQIVAKKNGQLEFIIVRTACYPSKGQVENNQLAAQCIAYAHKHKAMCYFASVGIANVNGKNDAEMAIPIKGAGFYVSFEGLQILTHSDTTSIWKDRYDA